MIEQKLFALPEPELAEAPSSWLPRAAASQGESLNEFVQFLGFIPRRDFDIQFVHMAPRHIAKLCGLRPDAFDLQFQMLDVAQSLRMASPVWMSERKRPQYRYCPDCMKNQSTPYFPLHWRLDAYRMCHIHRCFLEEQCPHCKYLIFPQRDWMNAGDPRRDVSMASQCLKCSKFLWDVRPLMADRVVSMSHLEKARLENGRAFAAALAQGRVELPHSDVTDVRLGLKMIEKSRLLALGDVRGVAVFRRICDFEDAAPSIFQLEHLANEILASDCSPV